MITSDENLMEMWLDSHPVQSSIHLLYRTRLREVACMNEEITCRERRKRAMNIVSVGYANYANSVGV
jgi:hypothetical protein